LPANSAVEAVIHDAELLSLPAPAQRYLKFMGVAGRPKDSSFRLGFTGRFRTRAGEPWMKCEAWQYNSRVPLARIFHIRIRFAGFMPVLGRDTYQGGHGRMLVKLLDIFTLADGTGAEYDIGELVTWLNDAVLIAPSMLLDGPISWALVFHGHSSIPVCSISPLQTPGVRSVRA
jgi:hypothetical protein